MYNKFEGLSDEKKQRIIDAAVAEFAERRYDNASTNVIAREAGISKGILFHYFKTKKELYKYLIFYSLEIMYDSLIKEMKFESKDYFERMLENSRAKLCFFLQYPNLYKLIAAAFNESDTELINEINTRYMSVLGEYFAKLNQGVDLSLFRDDVDINMLNELVAWTAEGITAKLTKRFPEDISQLEEVVQLHNKELMKYMEIIKRGIYKRC
ncbi:MAG: hypothetical protein K0R84_472 [Clostridia bacterium]|nr:hypothetical protein [Clostridia bacterium]